MKKILTVFILMISMSVFSQEKDITGVVTDDTGEPMIGASLFIKKSSRGAMTDFDGVYSIRAKKGDVITFSYLGAESKKVTVGDADRIDVTLKKYAEALDEVIVVGYGTVKKSDLTGSVSSVKAEEITKTGSVSLDQALAGKASGVVVNSNSGTPGAGANITIRGISTISSSQPLYVIDGIPMENDVESDLNGNSTGGSDLSPLSLINPSDIESIEILKDASATAIYGSRASNGVVLITTKLGEIGKGVINVTHEYSTGSIVNTAVKVFDANEYWINLNEARINGGQSPIDEGLLSLAQAGEVPSQDWLSILLRPATTSNTNISFSGGNKETRYLFSTNVLNNTGLIKETNFKRIQSRLNLTTNVNKKVKIGTRITYSYVDTDTQATTTNNFTTSGTSSIIKRALRSNPTELYYEDGLYVFDDEDDDDTIDDENLQVTPLSFLQNNDWNTRQYQFLGNVFADFQLSKSLSFKTTLTYQNRMSKQRFYQNDLENIIDDPTNNKKGWAKTSDAQNLSSSITNQLTYNKKIGGNNLNVILGQSAEWRESEGIRTSNYGFANDLLGWYGLGTAGTNEQDIVSYTDSRLLSFFGRINYTYNKKWLFTLTGRYDGSSKFAENNKYGFFPAGAIAYKLSQEQFIKDIDAISEAKIRLSYGRTGNQAINQYNSLSLLTPDQYVSGDGAGGEDITTIYYSNQLPNPNLRWETTDQFDAGIDLAFFRNRVTLTADYYTKKTKDLLFKNNEVPSQSGQTTYAQNYGVVDVQGFELGLGVDIIRNQKMTWNFKGNFSVGKATMDGLITDYINAGSEVNGRVDGGTQRLINGEAIGTFYGWKTAGISQFDDFVEFQGLTYEDQVNLYNSDRLETFTYIPREDNSIPQEDLTHRPGEQLFEDVNGDGIIDNEDRQAIGNAQPDVTFGINNSFKIGNVDFSFFFDGQVGKEVANLLNFNLLTFSDGQQLSLVKDAWTPENQSTSLPKVKSQGGAAFIFSDRYVEDASFVRLQNITIGYNFPKKLVEKIGLSSLRVYGSANNIYTFTKYTGFSPDVSGFGNNNLALGHDNGGYPPIRTIRFGVNLNL
ncbi:TonB-dependent receptor [Wenyingzhuangia sp. 2_MG-2023]|uniref:SusC/RagA family TonB-linked outer membrane protein n=1 Tax=Wenyingzhuangia sp. 2_MG-2023 TaxID=3062639 RepID=UPI0026E2D27C|nr:TonB-dependent receptor [Wenyingzhuangia sp. 2_MG-2023]MDO6737742.1 TonB-dependent receptor [Wenyingzhuangia sp. 2_MG-2023]MDO6802026.1 TonB-dependent receptor [Wenyingzhuangia sp. 1_MG-2023]